MILESEYIVDDVTITVQQTAENITLQATQDGVSATYVVTVLTLVNEAFAGVWNDSLDWLDANTWNE